MVWLISCSLVVWWIGVGVVGEESVRCHLGDAWLLLELVCCGERRELEDSRCCSMEWEISLLVSALSGVGARVSVRFDGVHSLVLISICLSVVM